MTNSESTMRWQRKQAAKGLCRYCTNPAEKGGSCAFHRAENIRRNRERYRKKVGLPLDAPLHTRVKPAKTQVCLYLSKEAVEALVTLAIERGLSYGELVAELVRKECGPQP